jgi:hypothetical protein
MKVLMVDAAILPWLSGPKPLMRSPAICSSPREKGQQNHIQSRAESKIRESHG